MPELKLLILQIVVICSVARALGWAFARLHQPRVVGEIVAGILLGPSLFGWAAPEAMASLFPPQGLGAIYSLSQVGLLLFMFQVGLELDVGRLRRMGRTVVLTSNVSILVPFLGGAVLALFLHGQLSDASVPVGLFALFMGTAMSITAFPVLARILTERKLMQSRVGSIAISCAAVDDITAWCLLALLTALVRTGAGSPLWFTVGGLVVFVALMLWVVRPLLARSGAFDGEKTSTDALVFAVMLALVAAWVTEWLGVHALFGAFFAGAILPRSEALTRGVVGRLKFVNTVLLLPLFFAFTGLRMSVGLLGGGALWFYTALILTVAVAGKMLGCVASVRLSGMSWHDALSVGLLMNTRGLVELVILNVGLDLRVISPTVFSMMVLMALVTTFMTTPLLDLLSRRRGAGQLVLQGEAYEGIKAGL
ncbi:MAG TPA: cation:proton antiporter [Pyrinomonadaceae bacterium]|jgi:Kef-type K+ transport system membrane component KefB